MSKICDLNDQLLNWASATAEAKDTAPTTAAAAAAAALSATSTVTAAVYSQGFLKFLGDPGAAPRSDQPLRGQQSQLQGGQDPHAGSERGLSSATHVRRLNGHDFSKKGHAKKRTKNYYFEDFVYDFCTSFCTTFTTLFKAILSHFRGFNPHGTMFELLRRPCNALF